MKTFTLTNLLLLTSVTLFTACSNTAPTPKKVKQSTQSILGISGARVVKTSPTYTIENYSTRVQHSHVTPSVEVVSTPIYMEHISETYTQPNSIEVVSSPIQSIASNDIEIVSYGSSQPVVERLYQSNSRMLNQQIERSAKKLLGKKYVWGATGPYCYDCSGFTQKIFRDAGIKIPRVSRDQAKVGEYISYNNLQKGDMVFFDTQKRQTGKVTHVGIYLGNGNFIHASSGAKKIVIYNFNKKRFYKNRFLWGRRVIKDNRKLASL